MTYGTVVVDEQILNVTHMWLEDGYIKIRAHANVDHDITWNAKGPHQVFGPDGVLIVSSPGLAHSKPDFPRKGDEISLTLRIRASDKRGSRHGD